MNNQKKYPKRLSSGANNTVIAISQTEAAKLFDEDTRSDIGSEAEKMKYANSINGLLVKFIKIDFDKDLKSELLVMERIYPFDYRSYEREKRELWYDAFKHELIELHEKGFVHRDIKRPYGLAGEPYDNVLLTDKGLRLIDVGISALKHQVGEYIFNKYVEQELVEIADFEEYFLNR